MVDWLLVSSVEEEFSSGSTDELPMLVGIGTAMVRVKTCWVFVKVTTMVDAVLVSSGSMLLVLDDEASVLLVPTGIGTVMVRVKTR